MTVADHVHRGYKYKRHVDGGHECDECKRLGLLENKRFDLREFRGELDKTVTDKEQIDLFRRRLERLHTKYGLSYKHASIQLGISRWRVSEIMQRGKFPTGLKQSTIDALTQLHADVTSGKVSRARYKHNLVDAELARAAIKGLMLRGYPQIWIDEQLGFRRGQTNLILNQQDWVTKETDAQLTELARKYGTTVGPSKRVATMARNRGYESTVMRDEFL